MAQQNTTMARINIRPKKFNLIICEIHHPYIHGKTDESDSNIESHYLVVGRFDGTTEMTLYDGDDEVEYDDHFDLSIININDTIEGFTSYYYQAQHILNGRLPQHPSIRNFANIVTRAGYIRPEIAECIELPTMETIAILKTFWIRIIQRTWKKVFKQIQQVRNSRTQISALLYREIHGKWPQKCCYMPQLRGMLKGL